MVKNSYIIPIVCLIVISSLVVIVYNTHMLMKNIEAFTDCNDNCNATPNLKDTIRCLPKKNVKEYSTNKYYNFRDVKEQNALTLIGCLNDKYSDKMLSKISDICYTTYHEFNTAHKASKYKIYETILDDIRKTKGSDELLLDPVYAIVYEDSDDKEGYEVFTRLIMIYPNYPTQFEKQHIKLKKFFNQYVYSGNNPGCAATIYQLNKDHKMFYDLLQKKVYTTL